MKDIAEWLASLDLGEYAQRFAENAIDLSVIRDLTENDLKELGVLLGHRRKRPPNRGGIVPSDANLQLCFAIWSARLRSRRGLIRKTCAR
jgi:hypothetical protein